MYPRDDIMANNGTAETKYRVSTKNIRYEKVVKNGTTKTIYSFLKLIS